MHTQGLLLDSCCHPGCGKTRAHHAAGDCCSVGTRLLPQQLCRGAKLHRTSWGWFQSQSPLHLLPTASPLPGPPAPPRPTTPFPKWQLTAGTHPHVTFRSPWMHANVACILPPGCAHSYKPWGSWVRCWLSRAQLSPRYCSGDGNSPNRTPPLPVPRTGWEQEDGGPCGRDWGFPQKGGKTGKKERRMTFFTPCPESGTTKPGHRNRVPMMQPWPWGVGSPRLRGYPPWVAASPASILPAPQRIWAHGGSRGWQ